MEGTEVSREDKAEIKLEAETQVIYAVVYLNGKLIQQVDSPIAGKCSPVGSVYLRSLTLRKGLLASLIKIDST